MDWWTIDPEKPTQVAVDADAYMPDALREIDELWSSGPAERVTLTDDQRNEIARQWRHWDLNVELRQAGKFLQGQVMVRRVKGSKSFAVQDKSVEFSRSTGVIARELYKLARGYSPA